MRVLVTGAGGQVGAETAALCASLGDDVLAVAHGDLDIADRDAVLGLVTSWCPDAVVNPAAMTNVDGCEREPDQAYAVNALAVRHLAEGCSRVGAHLVHVSTDYVFSGNKGAPYHEWDDVGPLSVYARSKLAGEREATSAAAVVRTSWVFSRHGTGNFVRFVLDRLAAGGPLRFIDDQTGSPTSAEDLAVVLRRLAVDRRPGLFHATNAGPTTRYDQARSIAAAAGHDPAVVEPMSSSELEWLAQRPMNTALDNLALRLSGLPALTHHSEPLERLVKELVA
jgi:dTDP-4-dehydrorhamnose reductase